MLTKCCTCIADQATNGPRITKFRYRSLYIERRKPSAHTLRDTPSRNDGQSTENRANAPYAVRGASHLDNDSPSSEAAGPKDDNPVLPLRPAGTRIEVDEWCERVRMRVNVSLYACVCRTVAVTHSGIAGMEGGYKAARKC